MFKLLICNEAGYPEILYSDRAYIDPDAPTNIIICIPEQFIKICIKFTDVDEALSFIEILFESDKINIMEIMKSNPELEIEINDMYETMSEDEFSEILTAIDNSLEDYYNNQGDDNDDE